MKKFLKVVLMIILIVFVVYVVLVVRNLIIWNTIKQRVQSYKDKDNYYVKSSSSSNNEYARREIYYMNGKVLIHSYTLESYELDKKCGEEIYDTLKDNTLTRYNVTKDEVTTYEITDNNTELYNENPEDLMGYLVLGSNFKEALISSLTTAIENDVYNGEVCYKVHPYFNNEFPKYISESTGLIRGESYKYESTEYGVSDVQKDYIFEYGTVTENDLIIPKLEEKQNTLQDAKIEKTVTTEELIKYLNYYDSFFGTIKKIETKDNVTTITVKGLKQNDVNHRGEYTFKVNNYLKVYYKNEEINIEDLKVGKNIQIVSDGKIVDGTKNELLNVLKLNLLSDKK